MVLTSLGFDGKDLTSDVYYNREPRSAHTYNGVVVAEGKSGAARVTRPALPGGRAHSVLV